MTPTLCAAFQATAATYPERVALRTPGGAELTWRGYAERVRALAAGLAAHGVGPGDTVALMLANRPEAHLVDVAALHLGATPFSIYNTSSPEQIDYLLGNAEARIAITERAFEQRLRAGAAELPALEHVHVVDGAPGLDALAAAGDPSFDVEAAWCAVRADDVATLIYTSGTTGTPKGVELTHANLLWQSRTWIDAMQLPAEGGRLVSYLPMAHLADRMLAHYLAMVTGASITCVADPRTVVAALAEVRPTLWMGVPRVWEKLKAALEARSVAEPELEREAIAAQLGFEQGAFLMTGAAPIPIEVLEFFAELGIPVHEAYGLTECSSMVTVNRPGALRFGTVGKALPGVELDLADDGELLVRGPLLMRGYRDDPERTAEAIDAEGWMHTGDVAEIDADGYVRIVDRKKEIIINAAGKNMSPAAIENTLKAACPLIGIAVAIGDGRPYNVALLVLEPEAATAFAAEHEIAERSLEALARDPRVQAEVARGVERANERLSRAEQLKKHTIVPGEWLPAGEELTPTMKLKRKPIAARYAQLIERMYAA